MPQSDAFLGIFRVFFQLAAPSTTTSGASSSDAEKNQFFYGEYGFVTMKLDSTSHLDTNLITSITKKSSLGPKYYDLNQRNQDCILITFALRVSSKFLLRTLDTGRVRSNLKSFHIRLFINSFASANARTLEYFAQHWEITAHHVPLTWYVQTTQLLYYVWKTGEKLRILRQFHFLYEFRTTRILQDILPDSQQEKALFLLLSILFEDEMLDRLQNNPLILSFIPNFMESVETLLTPLRQRNVRILKVLSPIVTNTMLAAITIDDICYHEAVTWQGVHIMEVVQILMEDFSIGRQEITEQISMVEIRNDAMLHVFQALNGENV
eukprot:22929-Pleurochrysis_carterae.AAC.1